MKLRPFLSFYGAKWRAAPRYPAPKYDVVIEPFAGSAGYSIRHHGKQVFLIDKDPIIAAVWDYLIHVSVDEIAALPDISPGQSVDDLDIPQEARWLTGFWVNKGSAAPCQRFSAWHGRYANQFWGPKIRTRLAEQAPHIRHWQVYNCGYEDIPNVEATWFIDPPYRNKGHHYRFSDIDYEHLGEWCQGRQGQVIVCENEDADWLPFRELGNVKSNQANRKDGRTHTPELIWTNEPDLV